MHRAFQPAWILPIVAATHLAGGHFAGTRQPDPTRFVPTQTIRPSTPPVQPDGPRRIEVKAGDNWATAASAAQPGDEIVLLDGVHRSAVLEGLRGTATQPIVIRSADAAKLAEIAPDREGLKLVDCSHLRIERILVKSARRAGIVIEGTAAGACTDLTVVDTLVVGVSGLVEQAGLLVANASNIRVLRSRFDNCTGSALHLEQVRGFTAERLQMRAQKSSAYGISVLGDSEDLDFNDVWIGGPMQVAVSVGAKDAPRRGERTAPIRLPEPVRGPRPAGGDEPEADARKQAPPTTSGDGEVAREEDASTAGQDQPAGLARVRNASFSNLLIRGVERAFEFGSCELVRIGNSTIVEPTESVFMLVRAPKDRPAASVRFHDNIVVWEPGKLKQLGTVVEGAATEGLRLGPNLWFSTELPAALPLLGPEDNPFIGTAEVPQTIDIDPDLDSRSRPLRETAKLFGRTAG